MSAPLDSDFDPAQPLVPAAKTRFPWKWVLALAVIIAALFAAGCLHPEQWLSALLDRVSQLGPWGPVLYIPIYAIAAVFLVPGSVLTFGAGALFGLVYGSVIVSIAATLGATAAFLISRYLAREKVARRIAGNAKFAALDQAVAGEGWKIVFLTRLSPVFPFTLLNYAFGLTRVGLGQYVLATWVGMIPGVILYVYIGTLAQAGQRSRTAAEWALYGIGLVATIAVTVVITRLARRALGRRIGI